MSARNIRLRKAAKKPDNVEINDKASTVEDCSINATKNKNQSKNIKSVSSGKRKNSTESKEYPSKIKINLDEVSSTETKFKEEKPSKAVNKNVKTPKKRINKKENVIIKKKTTPKASSDRSKKKGVNDEPIPRCVKYVRLGDGPPSVPLTGKMYVGCHVSGAGGLWKAFVNAEECKAKSFALFLRNQRQWFAKPLENDVVVKWQKAIKDMPSHLILPHGSYLMNLGSPDPETLKKSRGMLLEEIQRCEKLGIPHFNFHPGSTLGKISREECCKTIAESINLILGETQGVICVLENMSCQGFTVGGDFYELRTIIEHVKDKARIGVCLDTCHAHAAGYDLGTEAGFQDMLSDFEKMVGWQFLRGLHINDSKGRSGDHLDRHEKIGKGTIGREGFRRIMNCDHFRDIPLILETPWTSNEEYAKEINILESLIKK